MTLQPVHFSLWVAGRFLHPSEEVCRIVEGRKLERIAIAASISFVSINMPCLRSCSCSTWRPDAFVPIALMGSARRIASRALSLRWSFDSKENWISYEMFQ